MKRLDEKLARIRAGQYRRQDFIIADAKDPDMGPSLTWSGPKREPDGSWTRYRTREEFLDQIRAIVRQGIVDIMLMLASNMERLGDEGLFKDSPVKPASAPTTPATSGGCAAHLPRGSPRARSARPRSRGPCTAPRRRYPARHHRHRPRPLLDHLQPRPRRRPGSLEAFAIPRRAAASAASVISSRCSTRTSRPGSPPEILPHYVNDNILRCLAGVHRPTGRSSSNAYNGPRRWRS